ncbi:MAG: hypothetical protein WBG70_06390 [Spirulinaceae cyanobacterium]
MGSYQQKKKSSFQPAQPSQNSGFLQPRTIRTIPPAQQQQGGQSLEQRWETYNKFQAMGDTCSLSKFSSPQTPSQPIQRKLSTDEIGNQVLPKKGGGSHIQCFWDEVFNLFNPEENTSEQSKGESQKDNHTSENTSYSNEEDIQELGGIRQEVYVVTDSQAYLRSKPPNLNTLNPKQLIPKDSQVEIIKTVSKGQDQYSLLVEALPEDFVGPPRTWGWTKKSNLAVLGSKKQTPLNEDDNTQSSEQQNSENNSEIELKDYDFETHTAEHNKKNQESRTGTRLADAMLSEAGFDPPAKWWDNFTTLQLFGKSVGSVYVEFAKLLKNAESLAVNEISADPAYLQFLEQKGLKAAHSANNVGKFLGIKRHSSIRKESENSTSQSMHVFGLAIDINYTENPWVSDSSGKEGVDKKGNKRKTQVLQDFLGRIGLLLNQTLRFEHTNPDKFNYDVMEVYDHNQVLDEAIEQYFSFLENSPEKDQELKSFLQQTKASEWRGLDIIEAKEKIKSDLEVMSAWWSRKNKQESVQKHGLMDLDRRLVSAMGAVGLDWGGKYGDFMHFDMRNAGIGKKIQKAKRIKEIKDLKNQIKEENKEKQKGKKK